MSDLGEIMPLVCAVPTYEDLVALVGSDVIVIGSGHSATRLRLDEVVPVRRGATLFYRAALTGPPGAEVGNGTHLSRVGDFLVRLRLVRVVRPDGSIVFETHAQAHLEELERAS